MPHGDYVYMNIISAETVRMCNFLPIGMAFGGVSNHLGFGETYFPVRIDKCFKMTFICKNIGDAIFDRVAI